MKRSRKRTLSETVETSEESNNDPPDDYNIKENGVSIQGRTVYETGLHPGTSSKDSAAGSSSPGSIERESSRGVPSTTTFWNATTTERNTDIASIHNVTIRGDTDLCTLLLLGFGDVYQALRNQDLKNRIVEECLNFSFERYFFPGDNYTVITDVNKLQAANININELYKPVEKSILYRHFVTEDKGRWRYEHGTDEDDRKSLYRDTCLKIYPKLQAFSDKLLNLLNDDHKGDKKYQQLFMSFAQVCGLRIFDETDTSYSLWLNKKEYLSMPDALVKSWNVYKDREGSHFVSKVVAVVEMQKSNRSNSEESRPHNLTCLRNRTTPDHPCAAHIDDCDKGQHMGDMIAVIQSGQSLFGMRGVYGMIVQGTKVTIVYYKGTEEYFQQIAKGIPTLGAEVWYSRPFNILASDGRRNLISLFLDLENFTKKEMDRISLSFVNDG